MTLRRPRPLALLLSAVLLSGCGLLPGDADGTPRQRFDQALDDVRSAVQREIDAAVAQAKDREAGETGDVGQPTPPEVDAIRTDTNTQFDYDGLHRPPSSR